VIITGTVKQGRWNRRHRRQKDDEAGNDNNYEDEAGKDGVDEEEVHSDEECIERHQGQG